MENFDNPMFMRQVIMDHYEYPRNKRIGEEGYVHEHMNTDSCIDDLLIFVKEDNGIIQDVCFEGEACTIATSSASIMTELLKGKTIEEAQTIIDDFFGMVNLQEYDADMLQEAVVFKNVGKQANRIKCATLAWRGVEKIIKER